MQENRFDAPIAREFRYGIFYVVEPQPYFSVMEKESAEANGALIAL